MAWQGRGQDTTPNFHSPSPNGGLLTPARIMKESDFESSTGNHISRYKALDSQEHLPTQAKHPFPGKN